MNWMGIALAAVVAFVAADVASAGNEPIAVKNVPSKRVVPAAKRKAAPKASVILKKVIILRAGDLTGVVKSTRGKPFADTMIELFDATGKLVAKTKTNAKGEYAFKGVEPGQYVAVVNGRTKLRLTMTNAAKVSRLLIIPPAAAAGAAGGGAAASGLTTWQWVAIGAGSAVVIGGGIALLSNSGGSSSRGPISP